MFDLKAIVFNILRRLGISARSLDSRQEADDIFAAKLSVATRSGKQLAEIGILKSCLLRRFEIEQPVAYASIDWDALMQLATKNDVKYAPLPKTQPVKRDLAILVDKAVSFAQIEETVRKSERKLLGEVWLFDVYEGKNLPEGKKSYAISMTLQDPEKDTKRQTDRSRDEEGYGKPATRTRSRTPLTEQSKKTTHTTFFRQWEEHLNTVKPANSSVGAT